MHILLSKLSRQFGTQTIFSNIDFEFASGGRYAILGGNGSGKSTLLKMVTGALTASKGEIQWKKNGNDIPKEKLPFEVSLAGPYLELIEELTPVEFLDHYRKFRSFQANLSSREILEKAMLEDAANKLIKNFSSGMKQRLRLVMAILSNSSLLILDEPVSNLDPAGVTWFQDLLKAKSGNRTLLVGSNFDENETFLCDQHLELRHYK